MLVHPYASRLVCANGAVAAHVIGTRAVERLAWPATSVSAYQADAILREIRDEVRACAAPAVFAVVVGEMRTAAETEADVALPLRSALGRLPAATADRMRASVLARFEGGADRSAFGLLNAVTALARDERDPALRWSLEALGASVAARVPGSSAGGRIDVTAAGAVTA